MCISELKMKQCISIERMLILALDESLEILELTKRDIEDRNTSYGRAKKVANKYIPVMLRNSNRLREFRLFMKENNIIGSTTDLTDRATNMIKFYC